MGSSDPEIDRRSSKQSVFREGNGPASGPFVRSSRLSLPFEVRIMDDSVPC